MAGNRPWFWVHSAYSILLTIAEVLVLVRALRQAQGSTPACSGRC